MDLVEFLEQLTKKGMGLAGVHPECGVHYELKLKRHHGPLSGRKPYLQIAWTKEPRSFGGRREAFDVYSDVDPIEGMTFEEMHAAAMANISRWWQWWTNRTKQGA